MCSRLNELFVMVFSGGGLFNKSVPGKLSENNLGYYWNVLVDIILLIRKKYGALLNSCKYNTEQND